MSITIENVSRRGFLRGMFSAGAFVLAVRYVPGVSFAQTQSASYLVDHAPLHPSVYVGVETDGTVYIVAHRSEMGTSSRTSVPLILADELDADWTRVKIEQALGDPRYGSQDTDGSKSVREFFNPMREAGATARLMLVRAAAQQWGVSPDECGTDLHQVVHGPSGRKADYGQLVAAAAKLPVPSKTRIEVQEALAMAVHRQGRKPLRPTRLLYGESRFWYRCETGWHALCRHRASSGAGREGQDPG